MALCIPSLIRSIKALLFEYPDIFGILNIAHISQNTRKKGRGQKNKMCVFTIQEAFVLSKKCQGTQIKAFLCFELKGDEKGRGTAITKLLLFGYPDICGICLIKQKFLVWLKHFFYDPSPFCAFFILRKKGRGNKK